jgi:hypothetical protein
MQVVMRDYLRSLWIEEWQPTSQWALLGWICFFVLFLVYASSQHQQGLFIDNVNLVVHEGGHALFGWFGNMPGLLGGTALQLVVPLLLASYFFGQRQAAAFAFCLFFFFENFLPIATYMADARALALSLVTIGDPEFITHDWHAIFSSVGLLEYDTKIATVVRFAGWAGMILTPCWLARHLPFPYRKKPGHDVR